MKHGWALCVTLFCGCSSIKTAGMRDARVLQQGKWEFTYENSTTASIPDAVLRRAARENPHVGPIIDSFPDSTLYALPSGFMAGFGIARGLAGGWEWNAAMGGFIESSMLEAGLKKRVYDHGPFMLTGYGRLAVGSAMNRWGYNPFLIFVPTSGSPTRGMDLETDSFEADLSLFSLYRVQSWLSVYYNAGLTAGNITYRIKDTSDSTAAVPTADGDVDIYGMKNHVGLALEWKYVELAVEQGIVFYGHGMVPSFGTRITFKNGMKK